MKNANFIGPSITMTPVAVCVDRPRGYVVSVGSKNLSRAQRETLSQGCPDATVRLSGGGVATGDSQVHVGGNAVQAGGSQWDGFFRSDYTIVPANSLVRTVAICAAIPALPDVEVVQSPTASVGLISHSSLSVDCPTGKKALSGGVMAPESVGVIFDSAPKSDGSGWTASVRNPETFVTNVTLHATLRAVCGTTK